LDWIGPGYFTTLFAVLFELEIESGASLGLAQETSRSSFAEINFIAPRGSAWLLYLLVLLAICDEAV
jgi:hypothetical protein